MIIKLGKHRGNFAYVFHLYAELYLGGGAYAPGDIILHGQFFLMNNYVNWLTFFSNLFMGGGGAEKNYPSGAKFLNTSLFIRL